MSEVRPAEFARMCGVSSSVISRKMKANTLVRNAAGLLDTDNPVNNRYMSRRWLKSNVEAVVNSGVDAEDVLKTVDFSTLDDSELAARFLLPSQALRMTMRELIVRYRGMEGLEKQIKMLRDLMAAEEKEQRNLAHRLELVDKDFVTSRIFQFLDTLMRQALEYPESAVDEIISLVQSEGIAARNDVTAKMQKGITGIIKGPKDNVIKELSGLQGKYQGSENIEEKLDAIVEKLEAKD